MKKIKLKYLSWITCIITFFSFVSGCSTPALLVNEATQALQSDSGITPELSFAVFGDVHTNMTNFKNAIDEISSINPDTDALILNGDIVEEGKKENYDMIADMLETEKDKLPEKVIKVIGNHEFYNYDESTKTDEDVKKFYQNFLEFAGRDKTYYDEWIKGFHFIMLGSDNIRRKNVTTTYADLSDEQLKWLEEKLSENNEPGKPVFIFIHQPMVSEFFGANAYCVIQGDKLRSIIGKYPSAVVFSSHTHKEFENDSVLKNMPFTQVYTGAVGYTLVRDESKLDGRKRSYDENNIVYVEVKDNKVTINGRDIFNHEWSFNEKN